MLVTYVNTKLKLRTKEFRARPLLDIMSLRH